MSFWINFKLLTHKHKIKKKKTKHPDAKKWSFKLIQSYYRTNMKKIRKFKGIKPKINTKKNKTKQKNSTMQTTRGNPKKVETWEPQIAKSDLFNKFQAIKTQT